MFRFAPNEVLKTLKEQSVAFNMHKNCVPIEVSSDQTHFVPLVRLAMPGMQFIPALIKSDLTIL